MQRYSGRLREVVAYENRPTWGLLLEEAQIHHHFGREFIIQHLSYDMRSFMLPLKVHHIPLEEKYIPVADPYLQIKGAPVIKTLR